MTQPDDPAKLTDTLDEGASEDDSVSRETIFTVHANDAEGFYKLIVTVATAFLGGSLIFMEKFLPEPTWWSFGFLTFGWFCLILAITRVTQVRRSNLAAARLALEKKFEESSRIGDESDKKATHAARFLIAGMCFMMVAGLIGLGGKIMTNKKPTAPQPLTREIRTIHYGSTGSGKGTGSGSGGADSSGGKSGTGGGSSGGQSGGSQGGKKK